MSLSHIVYRLDYTLSNLASRTAHPLLPLASNMLVNSILQSSNQPDWYLTAATSQTGKKHPDFKLI
jgi:hypothetical protein